MTQSGSNIKHSTIVQVKRHYGNHYGPWLQTKSWNFPICLFRKWGHVFEPNPNYHYRRKNKPYLDSHKVLKNLGFVLPTVNFKSTATLALNSIRWPNHLRKITPLQGWNHRENDFFCLDTCYLQEWNQLLNNREIPQLYPLLVHSSNPLFPTCLSNLCIWLYKSEW